MRLHSPSQPKKQASTFAAIIAYPELYFAKFVILAEGPSEEIVLPQIAAARQFQVDQSFVSLVPLGGRHVNHFWRLLNDLSIPHATLLDLDAGRETGGWARIKYVCQQLLQNGRDSSALLKFDHEGVSHELSEADLETLHGHSPNSIDELLPWCRHLEHLTSTSQDPSISISPCSTSFGMRTRA